MEVNIEDVKQWAMSAKRKTLVEEINKTVFDSHRPISSYNIYTYVDNLRKKDYNNETFGLSDEYEKRPEVQHAIKVIQTFDDTEYRYHYTNDQIKVFANAVITRFNLNDLVVPRIYTSGYNTVVNLVFKQHIPEPEEHQPEVSQPIEPDPTMGPTPLEN